MHMTSQLCAWSTVNIHVLSSVWLFVAPSPVAHQSPLSVEFSRQEYWRGLPLLTAGIFRPEDWTRVLPALEGWFFTTSATWEVLDIHKCYL